MLLSLMFLGAAILVLAGLRARGVSWLDTLLLVGAGIILAMHTLIWQVPQTPLTAYAPDPWKPTFARISLAFGPGPVFAAGALLGLRFFFTPVRGWPRAIYAISAILLLSPIILLFIIFPLVMTAG